jgi:dTDP-4-amino-4,6-dideoxygalactose transaminase
LVSSEEALVKKARFLSTQARDEAPHYEHSEIGYNYRMSNIVAGIGRGQMEVLDDHIARRRQVFEFYKNILSGVDGISFVEEQPDTFANRWLTTILIDPVLSGTDPDYIRTGLEKENIESRPVWKPMHMQPVFRQAPMYGGKVCEGIFEKGLCLPSGSNMEEADLKRIEDQLLKLFEVTKPAKWV